MRELALFDERRIGNDTHLCAKVFRRNCKHFRIRQECRNPVVQKDDNRRVEKIEHPVNGFRTVLYVY